MLTIHQSPPCVANKCYVPSWIRKHGVILINHHSPPHITNKCNVPSRRVKRGGIQTIHPFQPCITNTCYVPSWVLKNRGILWRGNNESSWNQSRQRERKWRWLKAQILFEGEKKGHLWPNKKQSSRKKKLRRPKETKRLRLLRCKFRLITQMRASNGLNRDAYFLFYRHNYVFAHFYVLHRYLLCWTSLPPGKKKDQQQNQKSAKPRLSNRLKWPIREWRELQGGPGWNTK